MIFKVFSIFDSKASGFMLPFFAANVAVAKRNVSRAVNDPTTDLHHFREDYSLFEVGEWDPDTGKLVVPMAPINHGILSTFVSRMEVNS